MFEHCITLADLNRTRAELIKQGKSPKEVNSVYNAVKVAIMSQRVERVSIPIFKPQSKEYLMYTAMPLIGMAEDSNNLEFTDKGVLI